MPSYSEEYVLRLAAAAYDHGLASFAVEARRAALLVIDMQAEYVEPGETPSWVPEATRLVTRLARLLVAARRTGLPIIHTAFARTHSGLDRPATGASMPNRYPGVPTPDLPCSPRFPAELAPREGEVVILKPSYGAFFDTPLDTILRNLGRDTVIVTGTMTNLCCGTTARQAYERGYRVVFVSDLTATNDSALHEAEIRTLRYGFARIATADEVLEMLGAADAEEDP